MENGEEQAYYQAMGDAAEAEAQAAMNAEAESKSQDEVKDDPVASYRAELKKKIEKMGSYEDGDYHDGRNDALTEIMQLIDYS